ncbi:hypothetical protein MWU50_00830 [Flavobacteriaceae bacterium S0862]|nr:hypothetical protein [Flavobacteriaceae bacterium S0862]
MIKFFRHIRKSLLLQNKTGKYFKYAIGEIILVVIGILIALQVNNWNENRLQIQKTRVLTKALLNDFEDNEKILKQKLKYTNGLVSRLIRFLEISDKPELNISRDSIKHYATAAFLSNDLKLQLDTYNQALNTGDLNNLNNQKLSIYFNDFQRSLNFYQVHTAISGKEFYQGSIYELRKQIGNLDILDDYRDYSNRVQFTSHKMSYKELVNFIGKKEVFAIFHNQLTIQYNFKEALGQMIIVNDSITQQLHKKLND